MMMTKMRIILGVMIAAILMAGCAGPSTPLQVAAAQGDLQGVRTLMEGAGVLKEDVADAYINAAGTGQLKVVQFFLGKGVDVDIRGTCYHPTYNMGGGFTEVAGEGYTALICAANRGDGRVVQFLLDQGADVNAKTLYHNTALREAAYMGRGQIVKLLIERGAQDISDSLKHTRYYKRHPEVIRLLEKAEARQLGLEPVTAASPAPAAPQASVPPASAPPAPALPPVHQQADRTPESDVDALPARHVKARPNAYAIVIGIETYRNKLPKADFASHDAKVMGDYLTRVMGYEEENVSVLINDRAAKSDVEKYVEHWLPNRVEPGASVFIYFSGHGAPDPKTGSAYLVPYDGDPTFIDATGYPLKRLYDQLGKLSAREVVVMLDSCFSGAGGRSVIARGMRPLVLSAENPVLAGGKTVVLTASRGDQVSSTYQQKSHGLLTYYFLKGLQGEAVNKDGSIDLTRVFAYVKPQVERRARRDFNNEQTPQLLGSSKLLTKGVHLVERPGR